MPRFNKNSIKELKEFLYNSYAHDAKLENVKYNSKEDSIQIELFNPIFNVKYDVTFLNIGIALAVKGEWPGSHETILSLTVEENYSYLRKFRLKGSEHFEDSLYLLFQMFSGDELHIVSKEVVIEVVA
ncbi:MAG: hypothetical protein IKO22_06620 [Oscillospiraceae bacterium]|nr:hypothetical protein [Oscillospiraceae bacterium]